MQVQTVDCSLSPAAKQARLLAAAFAAEQPTASASLASAEQSLAQALQQRSDALAALLEALSPDGASGSASSASEAAAVLSDEAAMAAALRAASTVAAADAIVAEQQAALAELEAVRKQYVVCSDCMQVAMFGCPRHVQRCCSCMCRCTGDPHRAFHAHEHSGAFAHLP